MGNKPKGKVWTCMTCGAMNIQRDGVCVICGTNKDTHRPRTEQPEQSDQVTHASQANHASSTQ
jgi:uncharacterized Zn finger protein (UPF0148 family)